MNTPKVSVLMTAYNREKYIAQAIRSVLQSTLQDFELIVVDDQSQDATLEVARSYATQDARVVVHQNPKNLGDYANRNRAADLARGKYLKYLDSDDTIYPHGLEVMVDVMERFPQAVLGLCRVASPDVPYPLQLLPEQSYREHFLENGWLACGPTGAIVLHAAFRGFSERRYVGDIETWLKMAAWHPSVKLMDGLVWWRNHGGQEYVAGQNSLGYAKWSYLIAFEALHSPACPLSPDDKEKALCQAKHRQVRNTLRLMLNQRKVQGGRRILHETGFGWRDVLHHLRRPH